MVGEISLEFESMGRVWLRNALTESTLLQFEKACILGNKPGARIEIRGAIADQLGAKSELGGLVRQVDSKTKAVRVLSFNKTAQSNWMVPWHQDRVIAVAAKHGLVGFDNWSQKSGV